VRHALAIQQVGRYGVLVGRRVGRLVLVEALLVLLDGLLHLGLLGIALLVELLGAEAAHTLGDGRYLVARARLLLARALVVVKALAIALLVQLDVVSLRHAALAESEVCGRA